MTTSVVNMRWDRRVVQRTGPQWKRVSKNGWSRTWMYSRRHYRSSVGGTGSIMDGDLDEFEGVTFDTMAGSFKRGAG